MSEWYKDWFNTKYYHVLYKNRDHEEAEAFIRELIDYLNIKPGSKVLDLACGRGRHALFLEQQGFNTTGIDLSEENITYAKRYQSENLHFRQQDMRDTISDHKFDVVLNLFTSFGYFDSMKDNEKVLNAVKSYLNKNGDLIIDFMNVVKVRKDLAEKETKEIDGIEFEISKTIDKDRIVKRIEFEDQNKSYQYAEKVQALTLTDFEKILGNQGFEIVNAFGDYKLRSYSEEESDRLIVHAKLK